MWFNLVFWFQMAQEDDDYFEMRIAVSVDDGVDVSCMTFKKKLETNEYVFPLT